MFRYYVRKSVQQSEYFDKNDSNQYVLYIFLSPFFSSFIVLYVRISVAHFMSNYSYCFTEPLTSILVYLNLALVSDPFSATN